MSIRVKMLVLIAAILLAVTIVVVWPNRPLRELQAISNLAFPPGTKLVNELEKRDDFLGQGYTVREFAVPSANEAARKGKCPTGFTMTTLRDSGIWPQLLRRGYKELTEACVLNLNSPTHQDFVVISGDRIFHMSIDK